MRWVVWREGEKASKASFSFLALPCWNPSLLGRCTMVHAHVCHAKLQAINVHRFKVGNYKYSMIRYFMNNFGILCSDTQGEFDADIYIAGFI